MGGGANAGRTRMSSARFGAPKGIRTPDLHLERVASWASRRWGRRGRRVYRVEPRGPVAARSGPGLPEQGQEGRRREARDGPEADDPAADAERKGPAVAAIGSGAPELDQRPESNRRERQAEDGEPRAQHRDLGRVADPQDGVGDERGRADK